MPASTGADLAARLCCYPGQHSAPSVGWAQGVRKIPKHDDWLCALSGKISANETRRGVDCGAPYAGKPLITTVPKARLGKRIGKLNDEDVVRLNRAPTVFLGLAR